jgi:hypothetical protein
MVVGIQRVVVAGKDYNQVERQNIVVIPEVVS